MKLLVRSALVAAFIAAPVTMAAAATAVQTISFGPSSTDYSYPTTGTASLAAFNTSLGTLTGVNVSYAYSGTMNGSLTNEASNAQSFQFTETSNGIFTFSGAYANSLTDQISASNFYTNVASGASVAFGPYTPSTTNSVSFSDASSLSSFSSTNLDFSFTTLTGQSFLGGGGNVHQNVGTAGSGSVTVTYSYDAVAAVPEPASWAMMVGGFGILGGALRRKSKPMVNFG